MFAACLMAAYDTGRSKAVNGCDSGDGICLSDRICIGFALYVYAIMLSMSLIVASANVDAIDPSVHIQHVAPRQRMACGVSCVGTQVPLSRLLPPISFLQEIGPTIHRLSSSMPIFYLYLAYGPVLLCIPISSVSTSRLVSSLFCGSRLPSLSAHTQSLPHPVFVYPRNNPPLQCSLWCTPLPPPPPYRSSPISITQAKSLHYRCS